MGLTTEKIYFINQKRIYSEKKIIDFKLELYLINLQIRVSLHLI